MEHIVSGHDLRHMVPTKLDNPEINSMDLYFKCLQCFTVTCCMPFELCFPKKSRLIFYDGESGYKNIPEENTARCHCRGCRPIGQKYRSVNRKFYTCFSKTFENCKYSGRIFSRLSRYLARFCNCLICIPCFIAACLFVIMLVLFYYLSYFRTEDIMEMGYFFEYYKEYTRKNLLYSIRSPIGWLSQLIEAFNRILE
ncbi:MAG: hypothetical protein MHMPM18_002665 [Marteilia pararefringens]